MNYGHLPAHHIPVGFHFHGGMMAEMKRKQRRKKRVASRARSRRTRNVRDKARELHTKREAEVYEKVLAAISLSRREGIDLAIAARIEGTRVRTIQRYAPSAIEKRKGMYRAKPSDRLPRPLSTVGPKGMRPLPVRSSKSASKVARYLNAVRTLIYKGDASALVPFRGKKIAGYRFVTNVAQLKRLADAGLLGLDRLYAGITRGR